LVIPPRGIEASMKGANLILKLYWKLKYIVF